MKLPGLSKREQLYVQLTWTALPDQLNGMEFEMPGTASPSRLIPLLEIQPATTHTLRQ